MAADMRGGQPLSRTAASGLQTGGRRRRTLGGRVDSAKVGRLVFFNLRPMARVCGQRNGQGSGNRQGYGTRKAIQTTRDIQDSEKLCPQTGSWYHLMWSPGTFLVVATRNWAPAIRCVGGMTFGWCVCVEYSAPCLLSCCPKAERWVFTDFYPYPIPVRRSSTQPWCPVVIVGPPLLLPPNSARENEKVEQRKGQRERQRKKYNGRAGRAALLSLVICPPPPGNSSITSPSSPGGAKVITLPTFVSRKKAKTAGVALSSLKGRLAGGPEGVSTRMPSRLLSTSFCSGQPRLDT